MLHLWHIQSVFGFYFSCVEFLENQDLEPTLGFMVFDVERMKM